jgi:hypothetical protein
MFKLELKREDESLVTIREGFMYPDQILLGNTIVIGRWGNSFETDRIMMYMHDPIEETWEITTEDGSEYVLTPVESTTESYIN